MDFSLKNHLIHSGAAFFADPEAAHKGSMTFIARTRKIVEKALRTDD